MEVEGGEVSLTNCGRTRGSRFRLLLSRSDVPARAQAGHLLFLPTDRGSPPTFLKESMSRIHSEILRTGYITANNRR